MSKYKDYLIENDPDAFVNDEWSGEYDDSMDGDAESALASAGWGTDEDYGYFGDEEPF